MIEIRINGIDYPCQTNLSFVVSTQQSSTSFTISSKDKPNISTLDKLQVIQGDTCVYSGFIQTIAYNIEPNPNYNYILNIQCVNLISLFAQIKPYRFYPNSMVTEATAGNILSDLLTYYCSRLGIHYQARAELDFKFEYYSTANLTLLDIIKELCQYTNTYYYCDIDDYFVIRPLYEEPLNVINYNSRVKDVTYTQDNDRVTDLTVKFKLYTSNEETLKDFKFNAFKLTDDGDVNINDQDIKPEDLFLGNLNPNTDRDYLSDQYKFVNVGNYIYVKHQDGSSAGTLGVEYKSNDEDNKQQQAAFLWTESGIKGNKNYQYEAHILNTDYLVIPSRLYKVQTMNTTNQFLVNGLKQRTGNTYTFSRDISGEIDSIQTAIQFTANYFNKYDEPLSQLMLKTIYPITDDESKPFGYLGQGFIVNFPMRGIYNQKFFIHDIKFTLFSADNHIFEYDYTFTSRLILDYVDQPFSYQTKVREDQEFERSILFGDMQWFIENYICSTPSISSYVIGNSTIGNLYDGIDDWLCP